MREKLTTSLFIERASKIHQNKYDYSNSLYLGIKSKIKIKCSKHGEFEQTADSHLQGRGCYNCRIKYDYNYSLLNEENEINSYLLGAFITDGCVHKAQTRPRARSLSLDSQDYDWLENIKNIICPELKIRKEKTCYRLFFNQIKFVDWFIDRGITPNKSLNIEVPNIKQEFLPDFIRGCIDGDGSIGIYKNKYTNKYITKSGIINYYQGTITKPQCYICSASEKFIHGLSSLIKDAGFNNCMDAVKQKSSIIEGRKIFSNTTLYKVRLSTRICNNFLKWCYYSEHKISLPRKAKIVKQIREFYDNKN